MIFYLLNFQLGGIFSSREQKFYASAGAVAEEVLSMVHTIFMFGGEQRESERLARSCKKCACSPDLSALCIIEGCFVHLY